MMTIRGELAQELSAMFNEPRTGHYMLVYLDRYDALIANFGLTEELARARTIAAAHRSPDQEAAYHEGSDVAEVTQNREEMLERFNAYARKVTDTEAQRRELRSHFIAGFYDALQYLKTR